MKKETLPFAGIVSVRDAEQGHAQAKETFEESIIKISKQYNEEENENTGDDKN